ncbi:hypothetical protein [Sphaerisporangium corydalis]|uniref:Uncharacterized protein n=1 Tax=Sphaerisporangium corydalis TaxID=1441875 RepID=A0ABV9EH31_9ACTN|nr:hypothetical protein [Sphaerisporangium corydalis]
MSAIAADNRLRAWPGDLDRSIVALRASPLIKRTIAEANESGHQP